MLGKLIEKYIRNKKILRPILSYLAVLNPPAEKITNKIIITLNLLKLGYFLHLWLFNGDQF